MGAVAGDERFSKALALRFARMAAMPAFALAEKWRTSDVRSGCDTGRSWE
jgi:hypothetical protein